MDLRDTVVSAARAFASSQQFLDTDMNTQQIGGQVFSMIATYIPATHVTDRKTLDTPSQLTTLAWTSSSSAV